MLPGIEISPFKGPYDANVIISFDVETSALENNSLKKILIRKLNKILNKYRKHKKSLGYGIDNRNGIEKIIKIFKEFGIHATWFVTGHCLLKENIKKNRYRINQKLINPPYPHNWRMHKETFSDEPYTSYLHRPDYYLGDIIEKLYFDGEDIQCHTFSHTYLSLESNENIAIDLEDWQRTAVENGFNAAKILAFPYLGDSHLFYPELNIELPFPNYINNKKFIVKEISTDKLHILEKNGIELLTRSTSKVNNNTYNFFKYNSNTNLYCIKCEPIKLSEYDHNQWEDNIQKIINMKGIIDFWCHPFNINDETEGNFREFIKLLIQYYENDKANITTCIDAWEHFKKVRNIELRFSPVIDNYFEIFIINNNEEPLNDLCINYDQHKYTAIIPRENLNNIITSNNKFVFKQIGSKELFKLKFKIR